MSLATVTVHSSQFPENVRRDLLESLRQRQVNHKFHYDSLKQTAKWLALHEVHSPARSDAAVIQTYEQAFEGALRAVSVPDVRVIGLGCGGGQKDVRLITRLKETEHSVQYSPCDVSAAMVLVARRAAVEIISENDCHPLVCDLASADDLSSLFPVRSDVDQQRVVTFFGMIPNFEPDDILLKLASLLRRGDVLLFSANLAPGTDYAAGLQKILPQYDNALTRDWLLTFLFDLGVERDAGKVRFSIEDDPRGRGLKKVTADFQFESETNLRVDAESFSFLPGETIRLFYSYRYTPDRVARLLNSHGIRIDQSWVAPSGEEGLLLCSLGK